MKTKTIYTSPVTDMILLGCECIMDLADATNGHVNLAPARGVQHSNLGGSLGPSY